MAKELGEKQEVLSLGNKIGINIWIKKSQDLFSLSRWDDEVMPERIATLCVFTFGRICNSDRIEYQHLQCEKKTRGQSKQQSDNQLNKYFFRNNIFRHFVTIAFNILTFRILRQVTNFLET